MDNPLERGRRNATLTAVVIVVGEKIVIKSGTIVVRIGPKIVQRRPISRVVRAGDTVAIVSGSKPKMSRWIQSCVRGGYGSKRSVQYIIQVKVKYST